MHLKNPFGFITQHDLDYILNAGDHSKMAKDSKNTDTVFFFKNLYYQLAGFLFGLGPTISCDS
jgi:hypothetical protein